MISILKKAEKVNNECRDVEIERVKALAFWQTYMKTAK
jgi:hypothetical protein